NKLAKWYYNHFLHVQTQYMHRYKTDLVAAFGFFQASGHVDIITSAATHGFLPYMKTEQAVRAQIAQGVQTYQEAFGVKPQGIWLPECGYREGLDDILADYGIHYFFTDTHGVQHADPIPDIGEFSPLYTPTGVAAFARDKQTSKLVWSSAEGYPGDYDYLEYYRDIGHDLEIQQLQPYMHPSGVRLNTGIKYYRITGTGQEKELYDPDKAMEKVKLHARHFVEGSREKLLALAENQQAPIIVAAYDAELFGHWWYEGPMWLAAVFRLLHEDHERIASISPQQYLQQFPRQQEGSLSMSSWGRGGYGEVWLNEENEWIYRYLHHMEETMIRLADRFRSPSAIEKRALNQAAREIMLAQSSDWPFIMDHQTMVQYAVKRFWSHTHRFYGLKDQLEAGSFNESELLQMELEDAIFPAVDYRMYTKNRAASTYLHSMEHEGIAENKSERKQKILMLSWEYPPRTVGGLSRHVYDLSKNLASLGKEVHILTSHVDGYPNEEVIQGIHIHRVKTYQRKRVEFMDWIFQLNLAMVDAFRSWGDEGHTFSIIHAHDWLVASAAETIKQLSKLPLVVTIHATEYGRNRGIYSEQQKRIHYLEENLCAKSDQIICCSSYMQEEIGRLFSPQNAVHMVPNGVEPSLMMISEIELEWRRQFAEPHEQIVFFVGRLVQEKGVHILLESIPEILNRVPAVKFVIAGTGPMSEELKRMAAAKNIAKHVVFTGFVEDQLRNQLFAVSSVAVFPSLYEPFGIVALEAMAAGVPLIVSHTGGLKDIVEHGKTGFTIPPYHASELADHIVKILLDEGLAQSMAQQAYAKVVRHFNWGSIAEQTQSIYELAVHSKEQTSLTSMLIQQS
ncbi:MAG: glycosyl transferase family 1, partial [Paenibacillus sp. RIFOXYA1_FULL_44_5]